MTTGESKRSRARHGVTRADLLKTAAVAAPGLLLTEQARAAVSRVTGVRHRGRSDLRGMNVLMFITDQERSIQHFPRGWSQRNLPGLTRLQRHGLTFNHAFTNACMCTPARTTLMSGYFTHQTGCKYTLEADMPADTYPQAELPLDIPNIASVMSAAGYNVIYKGKWHCSKPAGELWAPSDLAKYGFSRWNPQDAGANQDIPEAGGGTYDNDGRFMNSRGSVERGDEGALQYLQTRAAKDAPFFMIVSLVNPHDVLFFPKKYQAAGYYDSDLEGEIELPSTIDESLKTKPAVQEQFLRLFNLSGKPRGPKQQRQYLNFYGNLIRQSDTYLAAVLDTLESTKLLNDTLVIRTADHGEMGLTHGGMRQKNFNFYEETMGVPLVYSNPRLFPKARRTDALVSHVDFLPTLAALFAAPRTARADWGGVDYSRKVLDPSSRPPQDYIVFTYDDFQSGQAKGPYPKPPNHIVGIREARWKLARYYDPAGKEPDQWEMYDLRTDPDERVNLCYPGHKRTAEQQRQLERLQRKLAQVEATRLQPR